MSTAARRKKIDRIDFRVSPEEKLKIKKAVEFAGESMADFVLKRIMPEVNRLIAQEEKIRLNKQAWSGFVHLLQNPKPASSSLKRAMQEYRETQEV